MITNTLLKRLPLPNPEELTPWGTALGVPVLTHCNLQDLPTNASGYTALNLGKDLGQEENLDRLLDDGWRCINWDGISSRPILDDTGRIWGVLAGRPADPSWDAYCKEMMAVMNREGARSGFPSGSTDPVRGKFPAVNVGVHHGLGTLHPFNFSLTPGALDIAMKNILADSSVQHIAGWQNEAFAYWAPKLHRHYQNSMDELWQHPSTLAFEDPLRPTFPGISVWPTAAFNFGPQVWCLRHRDVMDLSFGWCAVLALGNFDDTKGGHLVLPDLRMVIQFPSGSTIMIPSATLVHSNTPVSVSTGESRISFTQYCPGGLFRWVDCGFVTEKSLRENDPDKYDEIVKRKTERWERGLEMYSNIRDFPYNFGE